MSAISIKVMKCDVISSFVKDFDYVCHMKRMALTTNKLHTFLLIDFIHRSKM